MKINPESLARSSSRHPWRTVGIWVVILITAGAASSALLGSALTTDFDFTNSPEAKRAATILEQRQLKQSIIPESFVLTGGQGAVQDPAFAQQVNAALDDLRALGPDVVQSVPSQFPLPDDQAQDPQVAALGPIPSEDGTAVLFTVILTGDTDQTTKAVPALETIREKYSSGATSMYMLGQASSTEDFKKISEEDLRVGEGIGVLAAIVVLVIVFGSLVAGITPIVMGIFAISVALGIVGVIGKAWHFSFFAPNLISMMGLAVGIDYSLFIVSRYREERGRGRDKLEAIGMSGATANRAVFFSGLTVVLALAGMLLVPTTIFRSLAGGAIIVVLVSLALSMTMLPAILSLLGDKINAGRIFGRGREIEHGRPGGFWDTITRTVMARPVTWLVLASLFMITLSIPYFIQKQSTGDGRGIQTGLSGISSIPDGIQSKDAFNVLVAKFPQAGLESTADVVIPGAPSDATVSQGIDALTATVANDPAFGAPQPTQSSQDGTITLVRFPMAGEAADAQSEAAVLAIGRMRDTYVPQAFGENSGVLVGGDTAFVKDFFDVSTKYTPLIILLVLGLSFILLTVVFRSVVVPAKAIVMNLLSVGAAYGLIVLVFQKGDPNGNLLDRSMNWVGDTVARFSGFGRVDAIEAWLPLFLFSILFGLSMDYQVFLLSRIREEYDRTGDNSEAVAFGLRTTGGIITGAAIIMVAVFSGFASGRLTSLEQMGFGLAIAVLLDATIVRSIMVPSAMRLLGDRNWYLPKWLEWLPKVDVEGHASTVEVPELAEVSESSTS